MQANLDDVPSRADQISVWHALRDWIAASTFTPTWLKGPWRHPLIGYLVAVLLQLLAAAASALLVDAFPGFAFTGVLSLLMILIIALAWGAGPSLLAALAGAVLVNLVALPPHFGWTLRRPSDLVGLTIFLVGGLTIAVVGSLAERSRRDAHQTRAIAEEAMQRLRGIQAVTDIALTYQHVDDLVRRFLERITAVLAVDNAAILLLDETGQQLIIHQARGPEEEVAGQVRIPLGKGIAGRIAASRQPLFVDDLRFAEAANPFLKEHIRSLMGVPLLANGRVIGVLHVGTTSPRRFTDDDLKLLQLVADRMALALDQAQVYRAQQAVRAEATARANEIEAIFDAVFVYDAQGHIVRTNAAARTMMGLDAQPNYVTFSPTERGQLIGARDGSGGPLRTEEYGLTRLLRGEVLTGGNAMDVALTTLDGRELHVNIGGAPLCDVDGRIVGAVAVSRDVGERRLLERQTHDTLDALLELAHALVLASQDSTPGRNGRSPVGQQLVGLTRRVLGCQRVGIVTFDPERGVQHPVVGECRGRPGGRSPGPDRP
jgi:GAF domain-containing protein